MNKEILKKYAERFFELLDKEFKNSISYRYKLLFIKNEELNNYAISLAIDISNNGDKNIVDFITYNDYKKLDKELVTKFHGDFYNAQIYGKREDEFTLEDAKIDFFEICDFNYLENEEEI